MEGFSIGVLAERAGVTPGVLRTWENRFGFPSGTRSASGHRRFTDADLEMVRQVLAARAAGAPLQLAIDAVVRGGGAPRRSVYAAAAQEARPLRLGRRSLVAASHAVEDECLARGERAVVLGAFQVGHRYAASEHRWAELGRTAAWAAVLADFGDGEREAGGSPARYQLPADSPLRREWAVVCLGESYAAVVAAWEVPVVPGAAPSYEAVISTHRGAAKAAAGVLVSAVRSVGGTVPDEAARVVEDPAPGPATSAADADRTWLRVLAELDPLR
ncbi:DICT sensory domain-containing protein [Nocardioides xinjiangensis]|uniref:DICT sensory domain-containing protein n=1 Tax=Nocardioides xinjiangensis TaxID=2817376 RepID=UPI001B30BD87|nr:DICT sensory domain-containing protein [Nocardioides sp. SYSU D00778]